jgi:hypothetical protein
MREPTRRMEWLVLALMIAAYVLVATRGDVLWLLHR